MTPEQVAALYAATADDWAALGIAREVFTHNIAVKAGYEAEVGPYLEAGPRDEQRRGYPGAGRP